MTMKSTIVSVLMACSATLMFATEPTLFVQSTAGATEQIPVSSIVRITMDNETMNVETSGGVKTFAIGSLRGITTYEVDPRTVNLGLSVDWGISNLGTTDDYALGNRYSWGEIQPKTSFPIGGLLYEQNFSQLRSRGAIDADGNLTEAYDAATKTLGQGWRMPTRDEVTELNELCTTQWTQINGAWGQLLTGPNGATIFLPAHGQNYQGKEEGEGDYGMFWSATVDPTSPLTSYTLGVESRRVNWGVNNRYVGLPIRPVHVRNSAVTSGPDTPPSDYVNPKASVLYCQSTATGTARDAAMALGADADYTNYRGIVRLGAEFSLTAETADGTLHLGGSANKLSPDGEAIATGFAELTLSFVSCNMEELTYQNPVQIQSWGVCGSMTGWSSDIAMTPSADGLVFTAEVTMKQGDEFKVRANGAWNGINFGGTLVDGQAVVGNQQRSGNMWWDGSNFKAPKGGKLTVTLDLSAYPYKLTVR